MRCSAGRCTAPAAPRSCSGFIQQPGCPETSQTALSPQRLQALCAGECENPSDLRRNIEAIEIVRIRPRTASDEDPGDGIEDPWRRFPCEPDPAGCVVRFDDPEHAAGGRDVLYYARAIQEPTPAINGAGMRPERDAEGNVISVSPCFGDYRVDNADDCLAPARERAWSSPIFVDRPLPKSRAPSGLVSR
jgi:hypothetical protein